MFHHFVVKPRNLVFFATPATATLAALLPALQLLHIATCYDVQPHRNVAGSEKQGVEDGRSDYYSRDDWEEPPLLFRQSLSDRLDSCERALVSGSVSRETPKEHPDWLCAGLVGRVLRGNKEADFESLADDPSMRVVFVMGQDGLLNLVGNSAYEMLVAIGWSPADIQYDKNHNMHYKLVIFGSGVSAKSSLLDIRPATWDNLIALASGVYPTISDKLWKQLPALRSTSMEEIQRQAGYSFAQVQRAGPSVDSRYMTVARLERANGTLDQVRLFLYLQFEALEYYTGDGFTATPDGKGGWLHTLREFLMVERPLAALGDYRLIPLALDNTTTTTIVDAGQS